MTTDLEKYDKYIFKDGQLHPVEIWQIEDIPLFDYDWHHFLKKQVRKNQNENYIRWEKYQRMIAMPHQMNLDIETMGEIPFEEKWKIPKFVVVFNRDRWRTNFYESKFFESYYK